MHPTPGSILSDPPGSFLRLGQRSRVATCTGVAWFHGDHLGTANLQGNALHTYRLDPDGPALVPVQSLVGLDGIDWPDNLAFSPDGRLLALTNSRHGGVPIYFVEPSSHLVSEEPAAMLRYEGDANTHGVAFSRCSRVLAYTTIDEPGWVRLHRVAQVGGRLEVTPLQHIRNEHAPYKPKGIDFSPDGRFAVVCYASNVTPDARTEGRLEIRRFDAEAGLGDRPVSSGGPELGVGFPDDARFFADGSHVAVTDQARDVVLLVRFDAESGRLGELRMELENPAARLSFPHGVGVSPDGRYLGITNYGDDTLKLYAIRHGEPAAAA